MINSDKYSDNYEGKNTNFKTNRYTVLKRYDFRN